MTKGGKRLNGMRSARRVAQQGFTLVEMAIVLVIIGLIIGGVLKGQEIVNNGRVKTQVAQVDSIKAAVSTFQDTYGFYPGDYAASTGLISSGSTTFDGNEDGIVDAGSTGDTGATDGAVGGKEMGYAWIQLTLANLMGGATPTKGTSGGVSSTSYSLDGKIAGSFLAFGDFSFASLNPNLLNTGVTTATIAGKMVRIQGNGDIDTTTPKSIMRVVDASNIDLKYDDGDPTSGSILANNGTSGTTSCVASYAALTYGTGVGQYCVLMFLAQQ